MEWIYKLQIYRSVLMFTIYFSYSYLPKVQNDLNLVNGSKIKASLTWTVAAYPQNNKQAILSFPSGASCALHPRVWEVQWNKFSLPCHLLWKALQVNKVWNTFVQLNTWTFITRFPRIGFGMRSLKLSLSKIIIWNTVLPTRLACGNMCDVIDSTFNPVRKPSVNCKNIIQSLNFAKN